MGKFRHLMGTELGHPCRAFFAYLRGLCSSPGLRSEGFRALWVVPAPYDTQRAVGSPTYTSCEELPHVGVGRG